MIFIEKSGILLYRPGGLTKFRGIPILKPVLMYVGNWIEHYPSFPFKDFK
jgi:hypothetical protein